METDAADLSNKAAATLANVFSSLGLDTHQTGTTVSVKGEQVGVVSQVNNRLEQAGQHILAAEFDVLVGGIRLPELRAGVIGIDESPEAARDAAAKEWAFQYGIPIGFAIATRLGASGSPTTGSGIAEFYAMVEVDGQVLFHGPPGLRGSAKAPGDVTSAVFVREVAKVIAAGMRSRASSGRYQSATVQVVVLGTAVADGECRLDGMVSRDLLRTLSSLRWPEASPSYIFKLFLVGLVGGDARG